MYLMQFTHVANIHMYPLNLKKKKLLKNKVGEGVTPAFTPQRCEMAYFMLR